MSIMFFLINRKPLEHCGMLPFQILLSMVWFLSSGKRWVGKVLIHQLTSGTSYITFIGSLCYILVGHLSISYW